MSIRERPTGVTILAVLMLFASLWYLMTAAFYFFGGFIWIFTLGWLGAFAWMYGLLLGVLGLIGLGISGGLMQGVPQAYTLTKILAIIGLVFSIPELLYGFGIVGAIFYVLVLFYLSKPAVKAFFT
jgi:hypothetical protein